MLRFWIEISAAPEQGGLGFAVAIRRGSTEGEVVSQGSMIALGRLPWVAAAEGDAVASTDELERAAGLVTQGKKSSDKVRLLGRHLFECLLGAAAWERIKREAEEAGAREVELAIALPPSDGRLHGLPWEAMHDGEGFLAVDVDLTVAITRVVKTEHTVGAPAPREVKAPARVLFVIGTETRDPRIRVGMDVLGLLRGAERGPTGIDPQILQAASIESLEQACASFRPHIVHFVGHGRLKAGEGQLELRGEKPEEADWVGADTLLTALAAGDGPLPAMVLITGCHSAAGGEHLDPLAAHMVRRGIPVALGMAGRISDRVCRLFARRFGIAVSQGEPLVRALTAGRRAGLQRQVAAAADDPAWALPSIYLDDRVPIDRPLVDVENPSPVVSRVRGYDLKLEPVFCGRLELVELLDCLLDRENELDNLVAYTEGPPDLKLGRIRILREFMWRALRRGHLVVRIEDIGEDASRLPRSYAKLAIDMLAAILEARERFDLDVTAPGPLVSELARWTGLSLDLTNADSAGIRRGRLGAFVAGCLDKEEEIDGTEVRGSLKEVLAEELKQLADDARATHPESFGPEHRVVAVLGGIGKWGEATTLLCQSLLGVHGLGTEDEPVPVLAACAINDAPEPLMRGLERAGSSTSIQYVHLGRLAGEEEIFAYQTVLLHPSRKSVRDRKPLPPYVPNYEKDNGTVWEKALKEIVQGVPGNFGEPLVVAAPLLADLEILVKADEDDLMAGYLREQEGS